MRPVIRSPVVPTRIPEEIEAAIGWKVLMDSGAATEEDGRALEAWIRHSSANEDAWFSLSSSLSPFSAARRVPLRPGALSEAGLERAASRRKVLRGFAGLGALTLAGGFVAQRYVSLKDLTADHFTLTAQLKSVTLADGSDLVLGPRSAVDVEFSPEVRLLSLREGDLMIRGVATGSGPLVIKVDTMTLNAQGGSFVVRDRDGMSSMTAIDAPALVTCGAQSITLHPGHCVHLEAQRITSRAIDVKTDTGWVDGLLIVDDRTIEFVVNSLRPYFPGVIRLDPTVAKLRVTGVYHLADPLDTLDVIARTLNLSVERTTPYWISVSPGRQALTRT